MMNDDSRLQFSYVLSSGMMAYNGFLKGFHKCDNVEV